MSVVWIDGCDLADTASLGRWYGGTRTDWSVNATAGRFGGPALVQGNVNGNGYLTTALPAAAATLVVGFWCQRTGNAGSDRALLSFWDGATCQCCLIWNTAADYFLAYRGDQSGAFLAQSSAGSWPYNVGHHYQVKVQIGNSGLLQIRRDGGTTPVLDFSGDTQATGAAQATTVRWGYTGAGNGSIACALDDLWIVTADGTDPQDWLGDRRVYTLMPTGAGTTTGLTANTGANYAAVDETGGPDDDTTYVASSTATAADTYATADLPVGVVTIDAVGARVVAKKSDAGSRSVTPLLRSGGSDQAGTPAVLATTYGAFQTVWAQDPAGPAAWDAARVNALEVGVRVD